MTIPLHGSFSLWWKPSRTIHGSLWGLSHVSKVCNLNDHSSYASFEWRYFGPCVRKFCIMMRNLNCAIKMTVRRCFPVMHLSSHGVKNCEIAVWMPWPLNCDLGGGATWPSNHFRRLTKHFVIEINISNEISISIHVKKQAMLLPPALECWTANFSRIHVHCVT